MTNKKMFLNINIFILLLLIMLAPVHNAFASTQDYLSENYWTNAQCKIDNIAININGKTINIYYSLMRNSDYSIGAFVSINNTKEIDPIESLNPKVSILLKDNQNTNQSSVISYNGKIDTISDSCDCRINTISSNTYHKMLSYIKTNRSIINDVVSLFVTINNTRYMLYDNIDVTEIKYIGNENITKSTTKSENLDESTTIIKNKPNDVNNITNKYDKKINSSETNTKYNNAFANQPTTQINSTTNVNSSINKNIKIYDKGQFTNQSKIVMAIGLILAVIGISLLILSIIKNYINNSIKRKINELVKNESTNDTNNSRSSSGEKDK